MCQRVNSILNEPRSIKPNADPTCPKGLGDDRRCRLVNRFSQNKRTDVSTSERVHRFTAPCGVPGLNATTTRSLQESNFREMEVQSSWERTPGPVSPKDRAHLYADTDTRAPVLCKFPGREPLRGRGTRALRIFQSRPVLTGLIKRRALHEEFPDSFHAESNWISRSGTVYICVEERYGQRARPFDVPRSDTVELSLEWCRSALCYIATK